VNDLEKRPNFDLSSMTGALGNITPPQLPSVNPNAGIIGHWLHGKKMDMASRSFGNEATIARHQRDMVQARTEMIMTVLLAGDRYKAECHKLEHESVMRDMDKQYRKEEVTGLQLRNQILYEQAREAKFSADTAELDFNQRKKAMEQYE